MLKHDITSSKYNSNANCTLFLVYLNHVLNVVFVRTPNVAITKLIYFFGWYLYFEFLSFMQLVLLFLKLQFIFASKFIDVINVFLSITCNLKEKYFSSPFSTLSNFNIIRLWIFRLNYYDYDTDESLSVFILCQTSKCTQYRNFEATIFCDLFYCLMVKVKWNEIVSFLFFAVSF